MNILGISCHFHDSAAALLMDGTLVAAAEEERFSRVQHDRAYPRRAISFCLRSGGISPSDIDYVVFYEKPLLKLERIIKSCAHTYPRSSGSFSDAISGLLGHRLDVRQEIIDHLALPEDKILFTEHHIAHAASAFFSSPFEQAAILTIDGVGEWATATIGRGTADWDGTSQNRIEILQELNYPHSLGLLYSVFTSYLGFKVNEGEYKVMGMAPYGRPIYLDKVWRVLRAHDDGSIELDLSYFSFHYSRNDNFTQKFIDLFGPARASESEFYTRTTNPKADYPGWDERVATENQRFADIAASIQTATELIVLKMAEAAYRKTGLRKLVMAGGVALNSVANGRILRESSFDDVFIQPAAGDSGGALGAALYVHHVLLGNRRTWVQEHNYWGAEYSNDEISRAITKYPFPFDGFESLDRLIDTVVYALTSGKVVGWFQGRFEWGPRALGNRSILADPRRAEMKEIVNTKIKFREPFRPFAPAILEECAEEYFCLDGKSQQYPVRSMLTVVPFKEPQGSKVPAVCHVGGTGRLQTVRSEWNNRYYELIKKFGDATGVPILLNTSFNLRGEPIVNTPSDALKTFSACNMDILVMGDFIVSRGSSGLVF